METPSKIYERQELAMSRLESAAEALASASRALGDAQPSGFWAKLGPIAVSLLTAVTLSLAGFSLGGLVELRRDFDVHLPHPHATVEQRLRACEAFMADGGRFNRGEGDRLAGLLQEHIGASMTEDEALRQRLLEQVDEDVSAFRSRR